MGAQDLNLHEAESTGHWHDAVGAQALAVSFSAEVDSVDDGRLRVRIGTRHFDAQRAFSCLVEPAVGDHVACWRAALPEGGDAVHVIAVLARPEGQAATRLKLAPHTEIDGERLVVRAGTLEVQAQSASFVYRSLHTLGELCQATIGQLRLAGAALSTVFDRQAHHAQQHQRTVEGIDILDAQVIEHRASQLMHLQGENLLANGDRLVKVRGTQIHFG